MANSKLQVVMRTATYERIKKMHEGTRVPMSVIAREWLEYALERYERTGLWRPACEEAGE